MACGLLPRWTNDHTACTGIFWIFPLRSMWREVPSLSWRSVVRCKIRVLKHRQQVEESPLLRGVEAVQLPNPVVPQGHSNHSTEVRGGTAFIISRVYWWSFYQRKRYVFVQEISECCCIVCQRWDKCWQVLYKAKELLEFLLVTWCLHILYTLYFDWVWVYVVISIKHSKERYLVRNCWELKNNPLRSATSINWCTM